MARKAAVKDYYIDTGLKTRRSEKREQTESGRMAAFIIDKIPKDFNIFTDHDINEVHFTHAIVETCGRWIRFCPQIGWLVYNDDEGRWTEKYAEAAVQRVITHFGNLAWESASRAAEGEVAFARHILSSAGIGAVKKILKCDTVVAVEQEKFDADPDLLNCKGDYYNLRTGQTRRCEPEDMFSMSTLFKANELKRDKDGEWELPGMGQDFDKFLSKITSKDGTRRVDLALFLMFYFGYSLTGDTGASFFLNFHGQGKNGKSVLLNLMKDLFGDYAIALPKDVVIENRFQSQFDLQCLPGKRLGVLIDAPEGRLNMDQLKTVIDGGAMNAKRKHLKDVDFKSVCKIAVGSNPKLTLKDTGMAIRRRIRMVPFDYTVSKEEDDSGLCRKLLKKDGPQILSHLIWFAHEYFKKGEGPGAFPKCEVIDEASDEYMESEDLVGRWVKERTEPVKGNMESTSDLYDDFERWAKDKEKVRKVMGQNKFSEHLLRHVTKKRMGNIWYYENIKLKYPVNPPLPDKGGG